MEMLLDHVSVMWWSCDCNVIVMSQACDVCVSMQGGAIVEADVNGKTPSTLARGRKHKDLLRLFENRRDGDEDWNWK